MLYGGCKTGVPTQGAERSVWDIPSKNVCVSRWKWLVPKQTHQNGSQELPKEIKEIGQRDWGDGEIAQQEHRADWGGRAMGCWSTGNPLLKAGDWLLSPKSHQNRPVFGTEFLDYWHKLGHWIGFLFVQRWCTYCTIVGHFLLDLF